MSAALIAERVALEPTMRLLDYGAGTGLLAQHLADRVGTTVLVEPSAGMREVLEEKIAKGVFPNGEVLDLDLSVSDAPEGLSCDIIVSLMAVHHILDIPAALRRMRRLLPPGGNLCILDLEEEDGSFHSPSFVGHRGIARSTLTEHLVSAGFAAPMFEHAFTLTKHERDYDVFLAVSAAS